MKRIVNTIEEDSIVLMRHCFTHDIGGNDGVFYYVKDCIMEQELIDFSEFFTDVTCYDEIRKVLLNEQ